MKIAFLTPTVPLHENAKVPRHYFQEIVGLAERGHSVTVCSSSIPDYEVDNVKFVSLERPTTFFKKITSAVGLFASRSRMRGSSWRHACKVHLRQQRLNKILRSCMPDIVHSHWAYPDGNAGCEVANNLGIPLVMTLRGIEHVENKEFGYGSTLEDYFRSNLKNALNAADAVTICCSDSLNRLKELKVYDEKKTHFLYHAVDKRRFVQEPSIGCEARTEFGLQSKKIIVCVAGMDHYRKGHHVLIRSMLQVIKAMPSAVLFLVGDGCLKHELINLADEIGVSENTVFAGAQHPSKIGAFFKAADCSVLPTLTEVFGNVAFESLISQVPTAVTAVGAPGEVFAHHNFGPVVAPSNVDELAKALLDMLQRPDYWRTRALAGSKFVEENMSLEKRLRGFEALYENLVAQGCSE